jgi:hypothetical protein
MATIKKFFFFTDKAVRKVTASVFQWESGKPVFIMNVKWDRHSFAGERTEVMHCLAKAGLISKLRYSKGYYLPNKYPFDIFELD